MAYCETITSPGLLSKYINEHKNGDTEHLRGSKSIDAPHEWDASYLCKARVVCPENDGKDFLGIAVDAVDDEGSPEWGEVIKPFPKRLEGRPYPHYHQHFRTGTAANYWQALRELNEHLASAEWRDEGAPPEDREGGTANAIMKAIRHSLVWYGPQTEQDPDDAKPMLSASPLRHEMEGKIPSFHVGIEATSDGEIRIDNPVRGKYTNSRDSVAAILQAKRQFKMKDVDIGKATIPDDVLAQVVGEALAFRGTKLCIDDTIIIIVAIRQLVSFISVRIPDDYCQGTVDDMRDAATVITVKSTAWLDQNISRDRKDILRNTARVVEWSRLKLQGRRSDD